MMRFGFLFFVTILFVALLHAADAVSLRMQKNAEQHRRACCSEWELLKDEQPTACQAGRLCLVDLDIRERAERCCLEGSDK